MNLSVPDLTDRLTRAFEACNVTEANAASVARALVNAEVDGQGGHGLSRVASYAAQAKAGKVDGNAQPTLTWEKPGLLKIDANHGFAYPAIDAAIDVLPKAVDAQGIVATLITRSHHCGQLAAHVEKLANAGVMAIMVANSPKAMAPWGGSAPLFGTNPIAFGVPRPGQTPLVIDLSLSKVARGKVLAAHKRGEAIPDDWAIDTDGNPTTDPKKAMDGSMLPAGGAKGAALAMMVEILAATLTGANYSYEASSFFDDQGPPPGVGHTIIALTPGAGFAPRLEALLGEILSQDGTRLPGTKRLSLRDAAAAGGIDVPDTYMQEIDALITG